MPFCACLWGQERVDQDNPGNVKIALDPKWLLAPNSCLV